jgi:hypothetical protein
MARSHAGGGRRQERQVPQLRFRCSDSVAVSRRACDRGEKPKPAGSEGREFHDRSQTDPISLSAMQEADTHTCSCAWQECQMSGLRCRSEHPVSENGQTPSVSERSGWAHARKKRQTLRFELPPRFGAVGQKLQSYGMALTSAILMLPRCTSCWLGLPLGISAWLVLCL